MQKSVGRDYVADSIQVEALLNPIVVPVSEIDLSIDRRVFLRTVFEMVTAGATHQERVESWIRFLQDRVAHPRHVTMHPDGVMLSDPIWILTHRLGQCGQTNRVAVDGLSAVGYSARLAQLAGHVAAEVWFDGSWHFLDADWLGRGEFVRRPNGSLPSTIEIYNHPEWLAGIDQNAEFRDYPADIGMAGHNAYASMFTHVDLGNGIHTPFFLTKTATPEQEQDLTYGWSHVRVTTW